MLPRLIFVVSFVLFAASRHAAGQDAQAYVTSSSIEFLRIEAPFQLTRPLDLLAEGPVSISRIAFAERDNNLRMRMTYEEHSFKYPVHITVKLLGKGNDVLTTNTALFVPPKPVVEERLYSPSMRLPQFRMDFERGPAAPAVPYTLDLSKDVPKFILEIRGIHVPRRR